VGLLNCRRGKKDSGEPQKKQQDEERDFKKIDCNTEKLVASKDVEKTYRGERKVKT